MNGYCIRVGCVMKSSFLCSAFSQSSVCTHKADCVYMFAGNISLVTPSSYSPATKITLGTVNSNVGAQMVSVTPTHKLTVQEHVQPGLHRKQQFITSQTQVGLRPGLGSLAKHYWCTLIYFLNINVCFKMPACCQVEHKK